MKINKIKTFLGVELYEISNDYIHKLREAHPRPEQVFDYLPMYTVGNNNQVITADYYHQFAGLFENENKNDKFLFFNIETLDATLKEEISSAGIEELLKDLDIKKILSNFTPENEENLSHFCFPRCNFLIVEITYETSYDHEGGYDCDMTFDVLGYFDSNLNAIYFE